MNQAVEIIKALLEILSQCTFNADVAGARKITAVTVTAENFIAAQEAADAAIEEDTNE